MGRRLSCGVVWLVLLVLAGLAVPALAQGEGEQDYAGSVPAVPFPQGLEWINVPGPLTWENLRGKVVLLDFWSYGCVDCLQNLPDLQRLEAEFPNELVVIGVHSARFPNEGETENLRQAVQRYEIARPVVNDGDLLVWRAWGIRERPTLLLVDPRGMVFGFHTGGDVYRVLQPIIVGMIRQFDAQGLVNREPVVLAPQIEAQPETLLAFPGKVLADSEGGRLFIADSDHNRIVVADLSTYEVLSVVGGGGAGNRDGDYATARFNRPQGMALSADGQVLYVADTGNHTLRAIDLAAQRVSTLAGTGRPAREGATGGVGTEAALNSPWDLARVGDALYIAMAGSHQLWRYDIQSGVVSVHSGSGAEGAEDAPHARARFARPSGVTSDGQVLYFADSESSAVREADIDPAGGVRTVVGTGLLDSIGRGGVGEAALLQYPLGVTYGDGLLYVADTYNDLIRVIDPTTHEVHSLAGGAAAGYQDGDFTAARFDEPGGISYAVGRLYVADTNNHAIRVLDLAAETVSTVRFPNPEALQGDRDAVVVNPPFSGGEAVLAPQHVSVGEGVIRLDVVVPEGYKFNDIAPFTAEWHPDGSVIQIADADRAQRIVEPHMPLSVPVTLVEGEAQLTVDLTTYYCEAVNESLCFVDRVRISLPVRVDRSGGSAELLIEHRVVPPNASPGP